MLYDAYGKEIRPGTPPPAGSLVRWEPNDRAADADISRGLTPERLDSILVAANAGDIEDQARLAAELEEKNWDIAQALQTRRAAVAGLEWEVVPADDSAGAKRVAADVEEVLRTPRWEQTDDLIATFDQALVYELMGAVLPGFAVVEVVWGKGGKTIEGFAGIEQRHFTFRESRRPRLVTREAPLGIELPANKFIVHRYAARSGDATRGGLIRPLAWMDVFQRTLAMKDLVRFIERYGMPFLVAKVSDQAWERDRNRIKYLIQNFGSDGGAVFTQAVETELLQAANAQGDVYFKLLEYMGAAITKVVLGQTATSGDAGGLSKGQAQENVRLDLLAMDARAIDATLTAYPIRHWCLYNHGPNAPVPRIRHKWEPPEDRKALADTLATLATAGLEVEDPTEVAAIVGVKLRRKAAAPPPIPADSQDGDQDLSGVRRRTPDTPAGGHGPLVTGAARGTRAAPEEKGPLPLSRGPGGAETARPRQDAGALALSTAAGDAEVVADSALEVFLQGRGLEEWWGPLRRALAAALEGDPDEAEFRRRLQALAAEIPELLKQMDSAEFEDVLARAIYTAAAGGIAWRAAELAGQERG